ALQVFDDLALLVLRFVERDTNLAAGRGDGAADQPGYAAVDVEVVDLPEAEQVAVEIPPLVHVAAIDVVSEVVEIVEAHALGPRIALAQPVEFGVVGRALLAVRVDEIDERAADADDRRRIDRLVVALIGRGAPGNRVIEGVPGVHYAPGHGRGTRTMFADEAHGVRAWLGVDDVVDVALPPDRDVSGPMLRNRPVSHALEQVGQLLRLRMRELDELEPVRARGIVLADPGR